MLKLYFNRKERLVWYLGLGVIAAALVSVLFIAGNLKPKDTSLVFTQWWEPEMEEGSLRSFVEEFEALHPDIKIQLDTRSYGEIRNQLFYDSPKDGSAPRGETGSPRSDILGLDSRWLRELIRRDFLEPLDEYAAGTQEETFEFQAIPLISFMRPLFYNIDLLEAAGFDRPPKNRGELLGAARAITNRGRNRYGLALSLSPEESLGLSGDILPWIEASGAPLIQEGGPQFNTSGVYDTLSFLSELYRNGLVSPDSFSKTEEEKLEEFLSGRIGMIIGSVADIPRVRERQINFGVTAVPPASGYFGKPLFNLNTWYAGINRVGSHKAEAWTFLRFLAEKRSLIGAAAHAVPGDRNAAGDYINNDPFYSKVYDIYESGEALEEYLTLIQVEEFEEIILEELRRMLEANQDPAATIAAVQRSLDGIYQP